jgi:hypothetical protein
MGMEKTRPDEPLGLRHEVNSTRSDGGQCSYGMPHLHSRKVKQYKRWQAQDRQ